MFSMVITSPDFVENQPILPKIIYALPDTKYTGWYHSDLDITIDKDIVKVKNDISIIFAKLNFQRSIYPVIKGIVTGEEYTGNYKKF